MLIYLAVAHDNPEHDTLTQELIDYGHTVIDAGFVAGDPIKALQRCDAVVVAADAPTDGMVKEAMAYAEAERIPVYEESPRMCRTEMTSPVQVDAFIATLMRMYRVHLDKNADYSPANILGTGFIGVTVRLWDKMARLFSLTGFRVEVRLVSYDGERANVVKDESVDDTLLDLANYGVIGRLLRAGKWGH